MQSRTKDWTSPGNMVHLEVEANCYLVIEYVWFLLAYVCAIMHNRSCMLVAWSVIKIVQSSYLKNPFSSMSSRCKILLYPYQQSRITFTEGYLKLMELVDGRCETMTKRRMAGTEHHPKRSVHTLSSPVMWKHVFEKRLSPTALRRTF